MALNRCYGGWEYLAVLPQSNLAGAVLHLGSVGSLRSVGSVGSLGSLGSLGSVGCLGSVGSSI